MELGMGDEIGRQLGAWARNIRTCLYSGRILGLRRRACTVALGDSLAGRRLLMDEKEPAICSLGAIRGRKISCLIDEWYCEN
jgi:hypothetical protein